MISHEIGLRDQICRLDLVFSESKVRESEAAPSATAASTAARTENASKISQLAETLVAAAEEMELMEPFSRIIRAFDAIAEAESK